MLQLSALLLRQRLSMEEIHPANGKQFPPGCRMANSWASYHVRRRPLREAFLAFIGSASNPLLCFVCMTMAALAFRPWATRCVAALLAIGFTAIEISLLDLGVWSRAAFIGSAVGGLFVAEFASCVAMPLIRAALKVLGIVSAKVRMEGS